MKTTTDSSIAELLQSLGVDVISESGREITARCPFHPDKHPSFSANNKSGLWICYSCGAGGTIEKLMTLLSGKDSPKESLREIKRNQITRVRETKSAPVSRNPFYLYAQYNSFKDPPDWAIEERFITREQADLFGLHWSKGWIIPIWAPRVRDIAADFWGWQFKRMEVVLNYPKQIKKSQTLFGHHLVKDGQVILVESPLDVVRLASAGIAAVASYGAFVSRYQLGLLEGRYERIILGLDADRGGRPQMDRIEPWLSRRMPCRRIDWAAAGGKDPGDLTDDQIKELGL